MRTASLILTLLILFAVHLPYTFSQEPTREFVRAVQDADVLFYFYEDYRAAAVAYEQLLKENPGNHNLSAKLGICYLNYGGRHPEAIPLLEYAAKKTASSESEYIEFGNEAPPETLYYLAFAYHIGNSLDRAIATYTDLLRKPAARGGLKTEYINRQIEACRLAMKAMETPAAIQTELFFAGLEEYGGAMNPVVSQNDSVFLFTYNDGGQTRIYCSYRTETWSRPEDITRQLGNFDEMYTNSVTSDGSFLVVNVYSGASGSLYYSQRTGRKWSKLTRFPKPVTSKYWEAHGFISPDGNRLWFSSNRPGGKGELDIYVSERTGQGSWGEPVNQGSVINTPYNENAPFADENEGVLYFSSEGHNGIGGYDIFRSVSDGKRWSKPVLMPYPLNTTGNNTFLGLTANREAYLLTPGHSGSPDGLIQKMEVGGYTAMTNIAITGVVTAGDGLPVDTSLTDIRLVDPGKTTEPVKISGGSDFRAVTTPGEKLLVVESAGYRTDTLLINIDSTYSIGEIKNDIVLVPERVGSGEFLTIRSVQFGFDSDVLSPPAQEELRQLAGLLQGHGYLMLEVTGYTDSRGTADYNMGLAKRRAAAVVAFLEKSIGQETGFRIKAAGATGFVALNSNPDGSDNPAGRAYNRRVTIGIVNPGTGLTLTPPVYVPDHLRHPRSGRYGIRLLTSAEKFYPDYFSSLGSAEMYFVRPVTEESGYSYILGDFPGQAAAREYLPRVVAAGFTAAEVISLYEIERDENEPLTGRLGQGGPGQVPVYTIQLFAGRKVTDTSIFRGEPFTILQGNDGLYRYVTGEFEGFTAARGELERLRSLGFSDAFIRDLGVLMRQSSEIIR